MARISLADNGSTDVRHDASNSRIVSLPTSPMRYSPAAVSWIAADRPLRSLPAALFLLIPSRRRQLALDLGAVHDAALLGVEGVAAVHGAPVVPQHAVAAAPAHPPAQPP